MAFSLKNQFKDLTLNLEGARDRAFQEALRGNLQKRDIVLLECLKVAPKAPAIEIPEGWDVTEAEFDDQPSHKQEKSVFYWLHRVFYHRAFTLSVPSGARKTIVLPKFPSRFWPLLTIEIGEGAMVTLVDDYSLENTEETPFRSVVVNVGSEARVEWQGYQHNDATVTAFDHKRFILGSDVKLNVYHHVLGGQLSLDELLVEMIGDHSEVLSQTVFFGHDRQRQEMRVNHMHLGKDTKSNMISKGAVKDSAHGGFLGTIQMEHGCDGADGNLEEHNLLLSNTCKIDAVPGLEIGYHNVAAAHAAYMERVDDEKLFYLASRGIPKQEAIELIIEGFFLDAIQRMKDEPLQERVFDHILKYLR